MPWSAISAIGAGLAGAGGAYSAMFGGASPGISWGDVKKNLQYHKGMQQQSKPFLRWQRGERRRHAKWQARSFGDQAKRMGVSRYALLGNSPSGMTAAMPVSAGTQTPTSPGSDRGARFARMGQDIQRGVSGIIEAKKALSSMKVDEAQARLLDAQAKKLQAQTQTPDWTSGSGASITETNITPGEDIATHRQNITQRGGALETKPTLTQTGMIRNYPSQEIMDLISEDMVAKSLFYKGRLDYAQAMQRGYELRNNQLAMQRPLYKAYLKEKQYLEYVFKHKVRWDPTIQQKTSYFNRYGSTGSWRLDKRRRY